MSQLVGSPLTSASATVVVPTAASGGGGGSTASAFSCCPGNGESSSIGEDSIEMSDSQGNNNTMYHNGYLEATQDYHFPKRPPVDIAFRDVRYTVKRFNLAKAKFGEF